MADAVHLEELPLDEVVGFLESSGLFGLTPTNSDSVGVDLVAHESDTSQNSANSDDVKATTKREKEKSRQRRYRQRLKDSRQVLLAEIEELSADVSRLSDKQPLQNAATSSSWVTTLNRQRDKRRRAEAEHERLVATVSSQAAYLENLTSLVQFGTGEEHSLVPSPRLLKVPRLHCMTNIMQTTQMQQLEGCYARIDSVLSASGIHSLPESVHFTVHRHQSTGDVAFFQHLNKTLLPFSFQATCSALWKLLNLQEADQLDPNTPEPSADFVNKSRLVRPKEEAEMFQRYFSRRYMEANRMVVVWNSSYEGDGSFAGLRSDEIGWLALQPSGSGIQLEVCVQQVPMRCNVRGQEPALGGFHEVLHTSMDQDKDAVTMALERLLLNDVVAEVNC